MQISDTITIREANEADVGILVSLLRESFRDVAERFELTVENCPKNLAFCTDQRIAGDIERGLSYYILEQDRWACGCVALEKAGPEVCYLERLAVLPEHRGKGCGKMLVEHVFDKAAQNGSKRVEIGIISEDTKLRDWYERFGFVLKSTKTFDHLPFVVAFMAAQIGDSSKAEDS
ncbi:MAG: GNAT family N-acetyltransferase [Planctomycetota bacterium]|jgi:N-acetylglutamate synthase-like GNAT family acetyltransferase